MHSLHPCRSRLEAEKLTRQEVIKFDLSVPQERPVNTSFCLHPEVREILKKASDNSRVPMSRIVNVAVMDYLKTMGWHYL